MMKPHDIFKRRAFLKRAQHILKFLIVLPLLLLTITGGRASVFEFNTDGSISRFEASDYLSEMRHKHPSSQIFVPGPQNKYDAFINEASTQYDVDADLIHAVIFVESGYQPEAISPKGAEGLMQLMPETARQFGVRDTFDPKQNINGGTALLQHLLGKYEGDISLTLAAYNAGEAAVKKYNGVPPYQETKAYINKVVGLYKDK